MDIKNIIKNKIKNNNIYFNIVNEDSIMFVSSQGSFSINLNDYDANSYCYDLALLDLQEDLEKIASKIDSNMEEDCEGIYK